MLPAGCSRRLVAELRDALDACSERQLQLEKSLRISHRLLRAWEPARTPTLEPHPETETNEGDPSPACTHSPEDLKELELLTQALEKAVGVRKGISKARERDKTSSLKSESIATSPGMTASALPRVPGQAGSHSRETRNTKGTRQTTFPAKGHPEHRLLSVGVRKRVGLAEAARPRQDLKDQQMAPSATPQALKAFTLKEKGHLLQLPVAFRKLASQNARLWAQLNSTQTSDSTNATAAAKTQFLQKMQTTSGGTGAGLSAAEVEVEMARLQKACLLLRLRVRKELSAAPTNWMQEYYSLLTLEGLQAIVVQCLHRLQRLRAAEVELPRRSCPVGMPPRALVPCGSGAGPSWSPLLLAYSSTQELQTLAALRLRVAMLDQQIHLEKVLMAELLPLMSTQEPQGPPWLVLCRAVHSLLCEGGERFLTILRDDPAD
ncbi:uncharacterized protein C16orf59 homolog [Carlito syrichta]|uniref:Uncharacterized protein C16orf59 homolog n=1 Tax=Carlito syrichta TaxID=1868482 RepID=A0A1U7TJC5_CARSF|nr:uncharacterized protein C16orf59 homolog [Carlito syrichta]